MSCELCLKQSVPRTKFVRLLISELAIMPHLHKYWFTCRISSDEMWINGYCSMYVRLVWLCCTFIIIISAGFELSDCEQHWYLLSYFMYVFFVLLFSITCDFMIIKASKINTMVENEERDKQVSKFMSLKHIGAFLMLLGVVYGLLIISNNFTVPCENDFKSSKILRFNLNVLFLGIMIFYQLFEFLVLTCLVCCWLTTNRNETINDEAVVELYARPNLYRAVSELNIIDAHENLIDAHEKMVKRIRGITKGIGSFTCNLLGSLRQFFIV